MSDFELVKHVGKEKNRHGVLVDVEMDQWQIMFRGVRVGYVGKKPNSPVCLIRYYPESFHKEVREFVAQHNGEPTLISQPPKPEVLAAYQEEMEGDEDDDE